MKPLKLSLACAIIFTILLFPVVLLMVTGEITLFDLHGFGVDTEERVYLGTANGKILVWKDQQQIGTLHAPTSRGYQITVENDEILCATGSTDYRMNLDGNILEKATIPPPACTRPCNFSTAAPPPTEPLTGSGTSGAERALSGTPQKTRSSCTRCLLGCSPQRFSSMLPHSGGLLASFLFGISPFGK